MRHHVARRMWESIISTPLDLLKGSGINLTTIIYIRPSLLVTAAIALAILSGCSANHKSIYRHQNLTNTSSITTIDAKQRAILSSGNEKVQRFCSEPSPDVFSVIAQALSAGGTFGQSADPASLEAALNVAFSDSEQGSTIPRTQTINMLRELMFRTCERYLNGAYSDLEMSIQAIRDQRLMVSILAIEQITGAVTPKPVVIGAAGTSAAGAGDAAIVRLDDALKAKKAAKESYAKAKQDFDELNGENKECDSIAEVVKKGGDLNEDQKTKQPKCSEARTALASATELLAEKTDHYSDLKRLTSVSGVSSSTSLSNSAPGGLDRAHEESVIKVAETVNAIVQSSFNDKTEMMLFCLKTLTNQELANNLESAALATLRAQCLGYLGGRVEIEKQKLLEEIETSKARMANTDKADFDRQWPALEKLFKAGKKKIFIQSLKGKLIFPMQHKADCFTRADSRDGYLKCFEALPSGLKRNLPGMY